MEGGRRGFEELRKGIDERIEEESEDGSCWSPMYCWARRWVSIDRESGEKKRSGREKFETLMCFKPRLEY